MEPTFQVFIKPVGALCNLNCSYCYYLKNIDLISDSPHTMSLQILERFIEQQIKASTDEPLVFFSWHGGEPMLAGIEFYRKAVEFQKKYGNKNQLIRNGIQTNGTLITEDWADFFAKENFGIGISIDGPEELHNKFRCDKNGKESFNRILKGLEILNKKEIIPEVLCVVNAVNAQYPGEVYGFFKKLGIRFITFLPFVEYCADTELKSGLNSVKASDWGKFLIHVFDDWVENDIGNVKIQIIEETLRTAFNQEHSLCIFKKNCGKVPVLEHNGNLYSCDHFVDKKNLLGNISKKPLSFLIEGKQQKKFGELKSKTLPKYCLDCEVIDMCNGECPKNRFILSPHGEPGLNYLCNGYRMFFNHCRPFIREIKKLSEHQNQ